MAGTAQFGLNPDVVAPMMPGRGQRIGEQGGSLARRRFQRGRLFLRGKKRKVWVGRWREDVIENGEIRRIERSEVLGSLSEYPTRKLALRALEIRLAVINDPCYRAKPTSTFAKFASLWEATVLPQHKCSTQLTIRSQLRKHLVPFLGDYLLKDIDAQLIQRFVASLEASPKTVRNLKATISMMWSSAKAWGYVAHDALHGVVLPKPRRAHRFFLSAEEIQRIVAAAKEPFHSFYWLAAETGLRAGELCALTWDDIDFDRHLMHVRQSAWQGKLQEPKTETSVRSFALSSQLLEHLRARLLAWRPNHQGLIFATRNGSPWDGKKARKALGPILRGLGIPHCGLHAFRHANSSLMDRLGVPVKVRQQRLGHSDPNITLGTYTHVASEDDRRIAAQLGEILRPNAPKSGLAEMTVTGKVQ